jgi:hypothetical protein
MLHQFDEGRASRAGGRGTHSITRRPPARPSHEHTTATLWDAPRTLPEPARRMDAVVFDAYGWPRDLTDEQLLERLLALNRERAGVP